MSEPTFGIYIPSYKRAKTCTAHRFLQYGTYIVRASEEAEYREALKDVEDHIQVWAVEDELICGLTEVNQWLIDNAPEDVIAILDDDIHHFYYRMYDTVSLDDPEIVTAELERIGQLMADLKIGFGATDATIRPWNYDCEFSFKGCAGAVRWVNRPVFKSNMPTKSVTNMLDSLPAEIELFNDPAILEASCTWGAIFRKRLRVTAINKEAGTPLPETSPMVK